MPMFRWTKHGEKRSIMMPDKNELVIVEWPSFAPPDGPPEVFAGLVIQNDMKGLADTSVMYLKHLSGVQKPGRVVGKVEGFNRTSLKPIDGRRKALRKELHRIIADLHLVDTILDGEPWETEKTSSR